MEFCADRAVANRQKLEVKVWTFVEHQAAPQTASPSPSPSPAPAAEHKSFAGPFRARCSRQQQQQEEEEEAERAHPEWLDSPRGRLPLKCRTRNPAASLAEMRIRALSRSAVHLQYRAKRFESESEEATGRRSGDGVEDFRSPRRLRPVPAQSRQQPSCVALSLHSSDLKALAD